MQLFSIALNSKRVLVILKYLKEYPVYEKLQMQLNAMFKAIPPLLADRADGDVGIQITFIISCVGNENIFTSFF